MENIQKKNILKKKKRILSLLNLVSSFDETTIIFDGNPNHNYSKILKQSLNDALAMKTTIDQGVLKMIRRILNFFEKYFIVAPALYLKIL